MLVVDATKLVAGRTVLRVIEVIDAPREWVSRLTNPTPNRLMKLREVATYIAMSPRWVERLVMMGDFPPPLRVSDTAKRWRREEVDKWITNFKVRKVSLPDARTYATLGQDLPDYHPDKGKPKQ